MNFNIYDAELRSKNKINNLNVLIQINQNTSSSTHNQILMLENNIFINKNNINITEDFKPFSSSFLEVLEKNLKTQKKILSHSNELIELYREELKAEIAYLTKIQSKISSIN